jgi:hypothetical protein
VERDENPRIEQLSDEECWRLLADAPVGRIGVIVDDAPEIYPVNHLVDDAPIVFAPIPAPSSRVSPSTRSCASKSTASIPNCALGGAC